ncbi:MAG: prephenate dehydratase [Methanobrevibacter arboriphilus]|uniref:prephenate dehydratase n=1 Tax=Methanobrevibacter arboriphilus TaxID=39441 RepID=A0A843AF95_METAZ|nr:prephenate dehydratase [Methanobrevibacter arboriphilus]MBF4468451.1 prephenate dehydratase [Methanobrevibacter arboriphilus]
MAFLGPKGTFSHEAASILEGELVSYCSIPSVMSSVVTGECCKGIVPIENSIEGPVGLTLDLLAHKINLNIERELIIPINHNLLVDEDNYDNIIDINTIKDVYSHSQALAQCQNYLENHNMKTHFTLSTAAAAKSIKGKIGVGAIGTLKAAELYGLKAIDKNIQDIKNNQTRFIVLSKDQTEISGNDKTSILFSLFDDNPGGLHDILGIFAKNNINLTKIESRPSKEGLGKYIFFVDFEGHKNEDIVENILNTIEEKVSYLKILGSYPKVNFG